MKNYLFYLTFLFLLFATCSKEDEVELPRDVAVQVVEDEKSLETFLSSHFYNYEDFQNPDVQPEIIIDSLSGANADKIPLIDQVVKQMVRVRTADSIFVYHPLYTLVAREGIGRSPSIVDSTYLSYEGLLLNKSQFDRSFAPIWFDLTSVVRGFREGMPALKSGEFTVDENNNTTFSNYGQGALFMPSGLGYYNNASGGIPAYSPLIFKVNLYLVKQTDHDGDGILSADEFDRDGDGVPDDTDGDSIPDYLDAD